MELVHNPKLVQIVFSFSIDQNSGKNYLDQKLTKCVSIWPLKLTHNVSFWGPTYADPFSQFLGPETNKKSPFLGLEKVGP
jgi:hypothetical protein